MAPAPLGDDVGLSPGFRGKTDSGQPAVAVGEDADAGIRELAGNDVS
jgi:hypothetical protein